MRKNKMTIVIVLSLSLCCCKKNDPPELPDYDLTQEMSADITLIESVPNETEYYTYESTEYESTNVEQVSTTVPENDGIYYEKSWDAGKKDQMIMGSNVAGLVFGDKVYEFSRIVYCGEDGVGNIEGKNLGKVYAGYANEDGDVYEEVHEVDGYSPDYMVCVKSKNDGLASPHYGEDQYLLYFRLNDIFISDGKELFDLMKLDHAENVLVYSFADLDPIYNLPKEDIRELRDIMDNSIPVDSKEEKHSALAASMSRYSVGRLVLRFVDKNGLYQNVRVCDTDLDEKEVFLIVERKNDYDIVLKVGHAFMDYMNKFEDALKQ